MALQSRMRRETISPGPTRSGSHRQYLERCAQQSIFNTYTTMFELVILSETVPLLLSILFIAYCTGCKAKHCKCQSVSVHILYMLALLL